MERLRPHNVCRAARAARRTGISLAIAVLAGSCGQVGRPGPPARVFLITVDTLRADHVGFGGYPRDTSPALDGLAARSVVFDQAIAQWPKTGPSFASIFSGRYPQTTGLTHEAQIRLPEEFETLPELFQAAGYRTVAVVSNAVLQADKGWSQGFDEYLQTWKDGPHPESRFEWKEAFSAPRVNRLAGPLLERNADAAKLFVWLHYSDPHTPTFSLERQTNPFFGDPWYTGEEEVGAWFPKSALIGQQRELRYYVAQYDVNVLYADTYIARVLEQADALGLLEDALLIFTADHGEALGDHDHYGHGALPYNDTARVPLFFHRPDAVAEGRRVERPVELVDLYPTLRELIAPDAAIEGLEGSSLAGFLPPRGLRRGFDPATFRYAFSEAGNRNPPNVYYRSVQDQSLKLVFHPPIETTGREARFELYDLEKDPQESHDLFTEWSDDGRRLGTALADWMRVDPDAENGGSEDEIDAEMFEALRALGYVE